MIDFALSPSTRDLVALTHDMSLNPMRRISRYYDEHEHEEMKPEEVQEIRQKNDALNVRNFQTLKDSKEGFMLRGVILGEEQAWGDPMAGSAVSRSGLGNAAINAVATDEQKARFGKLFAAMAITEPCCGSDTASIQATARLDKATNEWIINGEKIFVTSGRNCEAVVVWASLDRSKGRPAIKSFVVEKTRPGCTVTKLEKKLGIRASDTAAIVFEECRIPYDNILGSPEIVEKEGGFRGVMATFDATRPGVAASAVGIAKAALDFTRDKLMEEGCTFPYDRGIHSLSAVQRDMMEMEANLDVARLLVWRAAAMMDQRLRNSKEASMAKAKAGRAATLVCQKCVTLMGPLGYSREWLLEKWMRDCKITDLYEGTGQINTLVVARQILGFTRNQLK
jgi:acyl-CoA dehydrogenase